MEWLSLIGFWECLKAALPNSAFLPDEDLRPARALKMKNGGRAVARPP
jgi:hypothetical protein